MKLLKQTLKNNWYVIAAALLMLGFSGVLTAIMSCGSSPDSRLSEALGNSVLSAAVLVSGIVLSFVISLIADNRYSGAAAAFFTVNAVLFCSISPGSEGLLYFSLIAAMIMLVFYYKNACPHSAVHTAVYYILLTALAVTAAISGGIEIFVILTAAAVMFAVNRKEITSAAARVINYIFCVLGIIAAVCFLVDGMDAYFRIKFVEGSTYHPEALFLTAKPFGEAEYYSHMMNVSSVYNLAKIFGYFGYAAGTAMCVVLAFFVLSLFVRCFGTDEKPSPAKILAAMMIAVKGIAGFFENFSFISGMSVRIPVLSDDIGGYLLTGVMLGFILVSDEIICSIKNMPGWLCGRISKKQGAAVPEPEPETVKPYLTLIISETDGDV